LSKLRTVSKHRNHNFIDLKLVTILGIEIIEGMRGVVTYHWVTEVFCYILRDVHEFSISGGGKNKPSQCLQCIEYSVEMSFAIQLRWQVIAFMQEFFMFKV
jgi:hypothetical protein